MVLRPSPPIIKFFVGILVQTIFSKRHFEINWPLDWNVNELERKLELEDMKRTHILIEKISYFIIRFY